MTRMGDSPDWIGFRVNQNGIAPLHDCVVALGLSDITRRGLVDYFRDHSEEFPQVKIGGKHYTRREWVAEWLEIFREPAIMRT
jgi:hypothetical protein